MALAKLHTLYRAEQDNDYELGRMCKKVVLP
jgi:hypothetical protein